MRKLIVVSLLVLPTISCVSTPLPINEKSHYIETTEFLHSQTSNGFEYGKAEWFRLAAKICGEKSISGELQYRSSKDNIRVLPAEFTGVEKWIVAFGNATCASS